MAGSYSTYEITLYGSLITRHLEQKGFLLIYIYIYVLCIL